MKREPIHLIIPAAGHAKRFKECGVDCPKPLIIFNGKPLILWALEGLRALWPHVRLTIVIHSGDRLEKPLENLLAPMNISYRLLTLTHRTQGPAETVLMAIEHFELWGPMIALDCDLFFQLSSPLLGNELIKDGFILTFPSCSPDFSYASVINGKVQGIAEKTVISSHAVAGCYGFPRAQDFLTVSRELMKNSDKREIFISDVIQKMIARGEDFKNFPLARHVSLGTPLHLAAALKARENEEI